MIEAGNVAGNQARMETYRANWDGFWRDAAKLVYPALAEAFTGSMARSKFMQAQPVTGSAHDPYTAQALRDGASVFEGFTMPRGQRWQGFELGDSDLMKKVAAQQWCDDLSLGLFKMRNDPESGFVGALHRSVLSLLSFGPQSLWIDERRDPWGRLAGISYESEFIGDIWAEWDSSGNVIRLHRRIVLTAEEAVRKWADEAPECCHKAVQGNNRTAEFTFLHIIEPNRRLDPERIDMMGKPWHGAYWCESDRDKGLFGQGGYHSLPRIFSSFATEGLAGYGTSPTMLVMPHVKQQQQMFADRLFGAEMRLLPTFLASDDALDNGALELKALGLTEGGLDDRGNPLVKELVMSSDGSGADQLTAELRGMIDQVYWRKLLQLNREYKSHIPAARIEEEKVEKGLLLGPLSEQEQRMLAPMTQRELSIMEDNGWLPEMPGEVAEYLADAGQVGLKYDNGLTALQEAGKSGAFLSLAQQVGLLAQFNPDYVEKFEREYPAENVLPELGRIAGVPAAMRATDQQREAYDQKKQQDAQLQQVLEAVPALAGAAKDMNAAAQPVMP